MEKSHVTGFLFVFLLGENARSEALPRHFVVENGGEGALLFPFWQGRSPFLTDEEMDKALTGELPLLYAETGERQYAQLGYAAAPPDLGLVLVFSPSRFR